MNNRPDTHWHIYESEQIKPEHRGKLVYVLEIPRNPGPPVMRDVFDPIGREFPSNTRERLVAVLSEADHGIIIKGVSKAAVYAVMELDPPMLRTDSEFLDYNRRIVRNSIDYFVREPYAAVETAPEIMVRTSSARQHLPTGRSVAGAIDL
jgi:hypothetical protein